MAVSNCSNCGGHQFSFDDRRYALQLLEGTPSGPGASREVAPVWVVACMTCGLIRLFSTHIVSDIDRLIRE